MDEQEAYNKFKELADNNRVIHTQIESIYPTSEGVMRVTLRCLDIDFEFSFDLLTQ